MCNRIRISSRSFWLYLVFFISVLFIDWFDFIAFVLKISQKTVLSGSIFLFIVLMIVGISFKKINFHQHRLYMWEICGLCILFTVGFIKSCYPDMGYDTFNYHIMAQESGFRNWFESPYFAVGNFQIWGFRLGERCFGIMRKILGYRMGTILNTLVLLISFQQIVCILEYIFTPILCYKKVENKNNRRLSIVFLSFFALMCHGSAMLLGSYYIDLLGLPMALECIWILLRSVDREVEKGDVFLFALINGLWFAIKLTNIVFIIPVVLMFIWTHKKQITFRIMCLSGAIALAPSVVYLVFNFICTSNPVFPYFNSIFRSPYFLQENWSDDRFGGTNLFEKIFWLFYLIFKPSYRQSEIPNRYTIVLIVGLIGMLLSIFNYFVKKRGKELFLLTLIIISSSVLWGMFAGIERYYMIGTVLIGIMASVPIFYLYNYKNKYLNWCGSILILVCCVTSSLELKDVYAGREWSWRETKYDTFSYNLSRIFKDHKVVDYNLVPEIDMFYISDSSQIGWAWLINKDASIINASYKNYLVDHEMSKVLEERIENQLQLNKNIYDIKECNFGELSVYCDLMSSKKLYIQDMNTFKTDIGEVIFVNLCYSGNKNNRIYYMKGTVYPENIYNSKGNCLSLIAGTLNSNYDKDWILKIYDKISDRQIGEKKFKNTDIGDVRIFLEKEVNMEDIYCKAYYDSGELINEGDNIFIMNLQLTNE